MNFDTKECFNNHKGYIDSYCKKESGGNTGYFMRMIMSWTMVMSVFVICILARGHICWVENRFWLYKKPYEGQWVISYFKNNLTSSPLLFSNPFNCLPPAPLFQYSIFGSHFFTFAVDSKIAPFTVISERCKCSNLILRGLRIVFPDSCDELIHDSPWSAYFQMWFFENS